MDGERVSEDLVLVAHVLHLQALKIVSVQVGFNLKLMLDVTLVKEMYNVVPCQKTRHVHEFSQEKRVNLKQITLCAFEHLDQRPFCQNSIYRLIVNSKVTRIPLL